MGHVQGFGLDLGKVVRVNWDLEAGFVEEPSGLKLL